MKNTPHLILCQMILKMPGLNCAFLKPAPYLLTAAGPPDGNLATAIERLDNTLTSMPVNSEIILIGDINVDYKNL